MTRGRMRAHRHPAARGEHLRDERRRGRVIRAARDTHDREERDQLPVLRRQADRDAGQADEDETPHDHAPRADAVGQHAKGRVRQARCDRVGADQESSACVRKPESGADERKQRAEQAVRDVVREMGDAESGEERAPRQRKSARSTPRSTLSMSRARPTRAASEITALSTGARSSSSVSVSGSATETYSSAIAGASM